MKKLTLAILLTLSGGVLAAPPMLPEEARKKLPPQALTQLNKLPKEDLDYIRVDATGQLAYVERFYFQENEPSPEPGDFAPDIDSSMAFKLHSRPGSANVIYLDFDGEVLTGRAWNNWAGAYSSE